jgi:hypothetical protein
VPAGLVVELALPIDVVVVAVVEPDVVALGSVVVVATVVVVVGYVTPILAALGEDDAAAINRRRQQVAPSSRCRGDARTSLHDRGRTHRRAPGDHERPHQNGLPEDSRTTPLDELTVAPSGSSLK